MKSIHQKSLLPLATITVLAALATLGCAQKNADKMSETPATNTAMEHANGTMDAVTNMPGTNGVPSKTMP